MLTSSIWNAPIEKKLQAAAAGDVSNVESTFGGGNISETMSNIIDKVQQEFHGFYFTNEKGPGKFYLTRFIVATNCPCIASKSVHLFIAYYTMLLRLT